MTACRLDSERAGSRSLGEEASMTANSNKSKQGNKAAHRVIAGVLCGASVLSLVLSLVMPPISQAIANDAQTAPTEETVMGGGSSSESTDVDNTTNGDTENQNSDDAEGDETGDDAQLEGQSEEEQQNEDTTTSDGEAVAAVAENEQTKAAAGEITSTEELRSKLEGVQEGKSASFMLMQNIEYNGEIFLRNSGSNITLNLNGFKIKHSGENQNKPLFSVSNGAEFTITDNPNQAGDGPLPSVVLDDQGQKFTPDYYGKNGKVGYDNDIPNKLTYCVTTSSVNGTGTGTTETLKTYEVNIKGAIVSTAPKDSALKLINVYEGGKFNLQGGTLTQKEGCNVGSLIYAENGSTVNMSGGYVCGASSKSQGAGIMVNANGNASTLNLTGGVIAANYAPQGAGVYSAYSNVSISENAVISGNATFNGANDQAGYGGGIMAVGGSVAVSGGYITNNRMAKFCGEDGSGNHGGGGLAANNGAHVTISGGQITDNYSQEAGGGVYVTDVDRAGVSRNDTARLNITGGTIASNVSFRSEGAGIRVGQMVDAMINAPKGKPVYITNNTCLSRFDWGGGGIFVQGDSKNASNAGRLFVYNSYISSNTAGGYGGGVAVCPSGKILVTGTEGTAIFGNTDAGDASSYKIENNKYNPSNNSGNNSSPHISGGGDGKDQDYVAYAYNPPVFRTNGHADFFLAAHDHTEPIAAVIGKMLGGGDAKYSGSIELKEKVSIPANGGVQVKNSIGLSSGVNTGDGAATAAQNAATTFITGNYSWDHGGGIMSNGDLYLGVPADTYVYPSLKLKATKALENKQTGKEETLTKDQFSFAVYRKDSATATAPSWNNDGFNNGGCTLVGSAKNDANGDITFDLGEQFIEKTAETDKITYYLVEDAGEDSDITYDPAVYEIVVTFEDRTTVLMSVPTQNNPNETKELKVHNYTIKSMNVIKHSGNSSSTPDNVQPDEDGYYSIGCSDDSKTFTNTYTPYTSSGSWTPKATKVVEGGEMKEFTLELADNEKFEGSSLKTVKTSATDKNPKTLNFGSIDYDLSELEGGDTTKRGASKTFTYYVREKDESSIFSHYKFDKSVYMFTVVAADNSKRTINCKVTYRKGTVDSDGKWVADASSADHELTDTDTPTFTNTYSTSLPLSGMSGVTLTYLAGAAVLCAAAAWMHIRRKANAKGGERRE